MSDLLSLTEGVAFSVIANAFWIVGLAILLAAFSFHYDRARRAGRSVRGQLGRRSFTLAAWASATLVCIGLAATSDRLWEAAIWLLFMVYSVANLIATWRGVEGNATDSRTGSG